MTNNIERLSPEAFSKLCDYLGVYCNYNDVDCVIDAIRKKKLKEIDEEINKKNLLSEIDRKNKLSEINEKIKEKISEIVNSSLEQEQEQEQLESDLYNDNSLHR